MDPLATQHYIELRYSIDRTWLLENYVDSNNSLDDLWREFGIGHLVIRRALKAHDLKKSSDNIREARTHKSEETNQRLYGHPYPNSFAHSVKRSNPEREIARILGSWRLDFIWGDTQLISPKELDFYLPHQAIAVEYNGEYWHKRDVWESDCLNGTSHSREAVKEKLCSQRGVRLVHIWESDWLAASDKSEYLRRKLRSVGLVLVV